MSAISKCIDLAAFGDGDTHDELAEQARLDYGALHTKIAELNMKLGAAGVIVLDFQKQRDMVFAMNDDLAKMNAQLRTALNETRETLKRYAVASETISESDQWEIDRVKCLEKWESMQ